MRKSDTDDRFVNSDFVIFSKLLLSGKLEFLTLEQEFQAVIFQFVQFSKFGIPPFQIDGHWNGEEFLIWNGIWKGMELGMHILMPN